MKDSSEQADAKSFAPFRVIDELVSTNLLELLVLGPGVDGNLEAVFLHVDEPCFFEPALVLMVSWYWLTVIRRRLA